MAAPQEIELFINLTEALFRLGKKDEVWKKIERELRVNEDPRLYNQQANLLARDGEYIKAVDAYERALQA